VPAPAKIYLWDLLGDGLETVECAVGSQNHLDSRHPGGRQGFCDPDAGCGIVGLQQWHDGRGLEHPG
jgi:hypothetical protein